MKEVAELTLEVDKELEDLITDKFDLQLEIMQGTREPLPNGWSRITLTISNNEKAKHIFAFIIRVISQSHQLNLN